MDNVHRAGYVGAEFRCGSGTGGSKMRMVIVLENGQLVDAVSLPFAALRAHILLVSGEDVGIAAPEPVLYDFPLLTLLILDHPIKPNEDPALVEN